MRAWPIFSTLRGYRASWIGPDLMAGLTLAAIAVPEQIATARLVNVAAAAGLYAFIIGSLFFAALGRGRCVSVGADSTIAPMLAVGVTALAAAGTARYIDLVAFLALMVGAVLLGVGLLRLGWIADFLSTPVTTGLLAGIAVDILVRQLPAILGVAQGGSTTVGRLRAMGDHTGQINGWSLGIGLAVFAVIVVAERVDRRIPGALIGLVLSTVVVASFGLASSGLAILGPIHGGPPSLSIPSASWSDIRALVGPALTVAFLCVAQTAATERSRAAAQPVTQDFNRDLFALGAGSIAAGFSGSFAVNSSPPRSEVMADAGSRSQATSVVAAIVVLAMVLLAAGLLKDLPEAALAAILIYIATRMLRVGELRSILRFDRLEFSLAIVTLLAVAIFGIQAGLVLAMLLALADRTRREARPGDAVLGREPGTDHWIPTDIGRPTEQVAGVVVYLSYAPLWYGNASHIRSRVNQIIDSAPGPVHSLVLDANAMSDIDYTGAQTLSDLAAGLRDRGLNMAIARSSHTVHHDLKYSGLLQSLGPGRIFDSVEDAVSALADEH